MIRRLDFAPLDGITRFVFRRVWARRFGGRLTERQRAFWRRCQKAGYAVEEGGLWHLTPAGFLVSNQIIGWMLDALAEDKRRRAEAAARGDFRVRLD